MSDSNSCDLSLEDLVAHLDGELGRSAGVEAHLAACAACRHEAGLLARAGSALEAFPSVEPDAGFADRVLAAAAADSGAPAAAPRGRLVRFWPAAAVAAAALAAFVLTRGGPEPTPVDEGGQVALRELSEEELLAIAADLPLLANLETLREDDDTESLIALIENLDILESVETQALDALDQLIAEEDGG